MHSFKNKKINSICIFAAILWVMGLLLISTYLIQVSRQKFTDASLICVLHANDHIQHEWLRKMVFPKVKFITCLSDFAECRGVMSHLWIDARMSWRLPPFSVFSTIQPSADIQVCIYNSECLPPYLTDLQHPQLSFVSRDLNPAMFF
jgi:hypothetical protein